MVFESSWSHTSRSGDHGLRCLGLCKVAEAMEDDLALAAEKVKSAKSLAEELSRPLSRSNIALEAIETVCGACKTSRSRAWKSRWPW